MGAPDFWDDADAAQELNQELLHSPVILLTGRGLDPLEEQEQELKQVQAWEQE